MADLWATYQSLVTFLGINAILALSVYATLAAGQLSLAQAAFMGIGAYTAALLTMRLQAPFPLALLAGGLVPALIALPLGIPVLRLRGVFLAIATIGFGEVVRVVIINLPVTGGALGLNGIPNKTRLWHVALVLALAVYFFWRLRGSRTGYGLEAIRQDETAARGMGVDRHQLQGVGVRRRGRPGRDSPGPWPPTTPTSSAPTSTASTGPSPFCCTPSWGAAGCSGVPCWGRGC